MTPKEKAEELVSKFKLQMPITVIPTRSTDANQFNCDIDLHSTFNNAKQCALIAVDEILNCDSYFKTIDDLRRFDYFWRAVYVEIEKL